MMNEAENPDVAKANRHTLPIARAFAHHTPSAAGLAKIRELRQCYSDLVDALGRNCPPSRQSSLAITALEESAMWAIKGVVLNDPDSVVEDRPPTVHIPGRVHTQDVADGTGLGPFDGTTPRVGTTAGFKSPATETKAVGDQP